MPSQRVDKPTSPPLLARASRPAQALLRGIGMGFVLGLLAVPILSLGVEHFAGHTRSVEVMNTWMAPLLSLSVGLSGGVAFLRQRRV